MENVRENAIVGCLLGTAVGDALGLPYEGMSARRGKRLFGPPLGYHFLLGRSMVSDDTEHACMTAQALIASGGQPQVFSADLAWRLRRWLLGAPGGVGLATLRAILKLWIGFPPRSSGMFSAGNGPAMRAPIIGVSYGDDESRLKLLVRQATTITHTDPKAFHGAMAVALAARLSASETPPDGNNFVDRLSLVLADEGADESLHLIRIAAESVGKFADTSDFARAQRWERGVSGYMLHTVPTVIHAWLHHPDDLRAGLIDIVSCGGDTDTTAAILGGIIGAHVGPDGVPHEWLDKLLVWPRTVRWMTALGESLAASATGNVACPPRLPIAGVVIRNALFDAIVLMHGVRRLLPPY
jgi:ADP-ribosyl-[dinitrogen reductase] hydrolase